MLAVIGGFVAPAPAFVPQPAVAAGAVKGVG